MRLATWRMTGQRKRRLLPLYWCFLGASFRLEDARYHSEVWTIMTEEILYARLKEALRDAIARHHLDERSISLKSRGLTPEEAIGRTARTDYPILNGREVMLQARFGEALGQAFTSAPVISRARWPMCLNWTRHMIPQAAGMLGTRSMPSCGRWARSVIRSTAAMTGRSCARNGMPLLSGSASVRRASPWWGSSLRCWHGCPKNSACGCWISIPRSWGRSGPACWWKTAWQPIRMWCGTGPSWCCARAARLQRFVRQFSGYRQAGAVLRYLLCRGGACPGGGTLLPHVGLRPARRDWYGVLLFGCRENVGCPTSS